MTPLEVESDFETAFAAAAEAMADADPPLVFSALEFRKGTDAREQPDERAELIIDCRVLEHRAGPLYLATIVFSINSPALKDDEPLHSANVAVLRAALRDGFIKAAFASSSIDLLGIWIGQASSLQEDSRWICAIEAKCGLNEI